ncbi:ATP-binding cassette, subfamily B [Hathewaya proteolytica DSM 3090]|uniref:ATP-binding cassette, subfamily B n=1 Tax=Hathewaya proteolytica DSM 3090 TaxID=1121331 RepID=A0A1M6R689_9CLOT|nr:ABC transporter ATP-binding protein [Hathewaya proteolytica]SHK27972.1 ATP-binding cassette, subfamily B [Hathewaya proteolytica DSM 3090]
MKFFKKYVKKYWKLFVLAVGCLSMEAFCDLLQPTIMSKIIDKGVKNGDLQYVMNMGILMLSVAAVGAIFAVSRNILATHVSYKFGAELRLDLFKKVQSLSFESVDKFGGASLVTRLTNDVTQVQNFTNGMMRIFVKAPILCVGSIVMAVKLNWRMSLVFLAVIPMVIIIIMINMRTGYPFFMKIQDKMDGVNGVMKEYLSGIRVVRAFNRCDYEEKKFEKANEDLADTSVKAMRIMAIFSPCIMLVVNLGIVAILWIGGIKVNNGTMAVGQIMAFINYMTQILFSLTMISHVFMMFIKAKASYERIGQVFKEDTVSEFGEQFFEDKYFEKQLEEYLKEQQPVLEFNKVEFSYYKDTGELALKDVSFKLNRGETLGIIGSTGSGKSTIISMIQGFYAPYSGEIKFNGVNIKDVDIKKLRGIMAVVPQKVVLFSGTIEDNIKWGDETADKNKVETMAKLSMAHEFIEGFPEKYGTMLGQGGVNLSGGQKQRISIARALMRQPQLFIMDDCTSALDVVTESKIRSALKNYSKGMTTIVVAQRITSVMYADKILVMDNGTVAGIGTHEELMDKCHIYKDIYTSQIGKGMENRGQSSAKTKL